MGPHPSATPGATLRKLNCDVALRLSIGGLTLARRTGTLAAGGSVKLVLRPKGVSRSLLRGRSRARLRISGTVTPLGGPTRRLLRTLVVVG